VQSGPVVVAIDDAQGVHPGGLEALVFALRRVTTGPLSVLLAARTEAPADPMTVGAPPLPFGWRNLLAAVPPGEQVRLAPLGIRQIQKLLPSAVTAAQARQVAAQSPGNPFWAREIAANLDSEHSALPPLAREMTGSLCGSLTPPACEAMAMVAAAGRITVSDALIALGYLEEPAAALDETVLRGLVVEEAGKVTAAHPLIGAAAMEILPPGRRAHLYRRLAACASNPERQAHFAALAAGPGPDPEVADALARRAQLRPDGRVPPAADDPAGQPGCHAGRGEHVPDRLLHQFQPERDPQGPTGSAGHRRAGRAVHDAGPLLLRVRRRDVPQPVLPARRPDRPGSQLRGGLDAADHLGPVAPIPNSDGIPTGGYYYRDSPFLALWASPAIEPGATFKYQAFFHPFSDADASTTPTRPT
jgi:hypothetical protein